MARPMGPRHARAIAKVSKIEQAVGDREKPTDQHGMDFHSGTRREYIETLLSSDKPRLARFVGVRLIGVR